jgi:hypothetical protein
MTAKSPVQRLNQSRKKQPGPKTKLSQNRRGSSVGFKKWVTQNFTWVSLGVIAFFYLLWILIFGMAFFEWDLINTGLFGTTHDSSYGGSQQAAIYVLISILFSTHFGIILYELIMNIALILLIWYSILVLKATGITQRWLWITIGFYCLFPEFIYIAGYTGKDQFVSVGVFAFLIKLYSIWRFNKINWKDLIILGALYALNVTLKVSSGVIIVALLALVLVMRSAWKRLGIILVGGLVLGIALQSLFNLSVTYQTSQGEAGAGYEVVIPTTMAWQFNAVGNIFNDPNANISEEARAYYDSTMSPEFWTHYNPFITDVMGRYSLQNPKPVGENPFWDLCFANLGSCLGGWFKLESWLFIPKDILRPLWRPDDPSVRPYFIANFNPTTIPTFNTNEFICEGLPTNFTKDDMKNCLITKLNSPESDVSAFVDSWSPFIRPEVTSGKLFPALTNALYEFFNSGTILMDGFWLFWANLVLLIIAIVKRNYRKLIPFLMVPISIYGSLILYAPNTQERYQFPIFYCIPFLIVIFVANRQNLLRAQKKIRSKRTNHS